MPPNKQPPLPPQSPPQGADAAPKTAKVTRLSRFRGDVARALGRRGQALLAADNLDERVPTLLPVELYYIIKEIGVDEAAPLMLAATPEQFCALCDLDCWEGGTFVAEELDAWLAPLLAQGREVLAESYLRLDEEIQVLFLQDSVRVLDNRQQDGNLRTGSEEAPWPDDVPTDAPWKASPEGFFTIIDVTRDREVPPLLLVDALRDYDANEAFRLLTAVRWEIVDPLLEQAKQFRDGRVLDLGFCGPEDAGRLFVAPPPLPPVLPPPVDDSDATLAAAAARRMLRAPLHPEPAGLPALYAEALAEGEGAFVAAMAYVDDAATLEALEAQLVVLINMAVVAYGNSPRNVGYVGQVARWVRDTLSLGLLAAHAATRPAPLRESDAEGDDGNHGDGEASQSARLAAPTPDVRPKAAQVAPEALAKLLAQIPLVHLFQRGVAEVRPLQRLAAKAAAEPAVAKWLDGASGGAAAAPDAGIAEGEAEARARHFLAALAAPRPRWGGQDPARPKALAAWKDHDDLAHTKAQLEALLHRLRGG